ncbi:tRNA1(Val) (adenine(37)-N6)-methyltransferase [Microscilla marina]|uniref:tRNA1(Val) (adenine(37)-N6)-methyltransferase n=1 Tax=Microscilla marina ATCC 23134 TaxID=313606 RepID=A1ZPW4_MICM2|nr:methyltransferase [Microscilla marina]EAY27619.1 SmtA protein [Microscilla marina ATCC 23134]
MANNYFQFKQFKIEQGNTAMKVCTDSCIFGASVQPAPHTQQVLDIGTGTGLLSLMLAQRTSNLDITAVEIDEAAYNQAKANIEASPWATRIEVHHQAIQHFAQKHPAQYGLIMTNPPFFENHLKTQNLSQNRALHSEALSFNDLLIAIDKLLAPDGTLAVLLPMYQMEVFTTKAGDYGLQVFEQLQIHNHPQKRNFRRICYFSRKALPNEPVSENELFIRNEQNEYTPEFVQLLKAYYLYL